jgi:hypothetical protein
MTTVSGESVTVGDTLAPAVQRASGQVLLGLMLTALTVLVSQIALTRVMSVLVNYHSAFLILSVVMLGMAASAVAVFLGMRRPENPVTVAAAVGAAYRSAACTLAAVVCVVVFVARDWGPWSQPLQLLLATALFFTWFFYSGYVVALILTHYARDTARLYWFDLVGAAGGCLLVVPLLNHLPALNVVLLCAAATALAGLLFARDHGDARDRRNGVLLTAALLLAWGATTLWPELLRLRFAKGQDQSQVRWERWNSLARVSVTTEIPGTSEAIELHQQRQGAPVDAKQVEELRRLWQAGWGTSRAFKGPVLPALWLQLDTDAGTPILERGVAALNEPGALDFLAWDVTAVGYAWRAALGPPPAHVFIVGGGGGRDVLTALSFDAGQVDVVEVNPGVIAAANDAFGDYSGRPYSHPRVRLTIGEARSELSRRAQHYDLMQMSMIDTWASSMAGSMVMTENSLYTAEAFDLYVSRLKPDGVLSVSRWYDPVRYGEAARALVLMADALHRAGVQRPGDHIALVTSPGFLDTAVVTLLLKRSPLTAEEREGLQKLCQERGYRMLWPPAGDDSQPPFDVARLMLPGSLLREEGRFDLTPSTDDRPFFFNIDRPLASWVDAIRTGDWTRGSRASLVLGSALLVMCYACLRFVVRPLRASGAVAWRPFLPPLLYFGGIGLGFMLIELALIQRYILFLGHPSYAISVVLFALLLFGGCGSFLTGNFGDARLGMATRLALLAIVAGTLVTAFLVPSWLLQASSWTWPARVALAVALIAPLGLCMGMIFPLGVRHLTTTGRQQLIPWMWGINGICGVIASVLGMLLAMTLSYTAVLVGAAVAYAMTLLSLSLPGFSAATGRHGPSTAGD